VLISIDAVNNVKRLKLTNCIKITGTGLQPLRGSTVIKQIDLSLVNDHYKSPVLNTSNSCDRVLPILDSIIAGEGCALMYLRFPAKFRDMEERSTESEFHAFVLRYNQMWGNREAISCFGCNKVIPGDENEWIETHLCYEYGFQGYTCYRCLKHYCYRCEIDGVTKPRITHCCSCTRDYCADCLEMTACHFCGQESCDDCYELECQCHQCNEKFCSDCVEKGVDIYECEHCHKYHCYECDNADFFYIYKCSRCRDGCCDACRIQKFKEGQ